MTSRRRINRVRSSRRGFLRQMVVGASAFGTSGLLAQSPAAPSAWKIATRPIPSSGEPLPIIGLGTARTFDVDPTSPVLPELRAVLKRFAELGGSLIDSSPMYGYSEAITGMLAQQLNLTDKLFFASKVWTEGKAEGNRQMDTSTKNFQTDVVDLMQVHNLVDLDVQLASIRERRDAGRVRYIGVTHYRDDMHEAIADLIEKEPLDFVQINYPGVSRNAEKRLLPAAADRGVAIIVNQAFERGRLFRVLQGQPVPDWAEPLGIKSWAQYLLKFVLSHPAVTTVIPAADKAEYIDDNMQAGRGPMPRQQLRARMAAHLQDII